MILCGHIKYYVTLKVTLTFLVNCMVYGYSLYCLICQFIPRQFLTESLQIFRLQIQMYDTSSIFLNWDISVFNCRIELKSALAKWDWRPASVFEHDICDMINLALNKMEETFQSNTLDWSSLVLLFFLSFLFFSTADFLQRFLRYFSTNLNEIWHVYSPWWDEVPEYNFKSIGPGVGTRLGSKVLLCFIIGKTLYTVRRDKNFTKRRKV